MYSKSPSNRTPKRPNEASGMQRPPKSRHTMVSEKCSLVDDNDSEAKLKTFKQKLPAAIDILTPTDCQELKLDGGLPELLEVGDRLPEYFVAVIRPNSFYNGNSYNRLEQESIVGEDLEMTLEIFRRGASDGDIGTRHLVYGLRNPAGSHEGLHGLYIFQWSTRVRSFFEQPGFFVFSFILAGFKDIQLEHELQVRAPARIVRWEVLDPYKNKPYTVRVGSCFRPLSIVRCNGHKKRIRFISVPKLVIKLMSNGKTLAQVCSKNVEITPDKLTMNIKDICIKSSRLDCIRPNYEAMLHISTRDEAFSVALPCRALKKITVHPSEIRKQLRPGQIIEELALEAFDEYGNHLKENEIILLRLDGLSIEDGSGVTSGAVIESKKKVDANGRIDLSNVLKVSKGYGKKVALSVMSKDEVVFELRFDTEIRELRAVQKVFTNCEAGSQLENVAFEVIDSDGEVDESIHDDDKHGQSHTLVMKCRSFPIHESVKYSFHNGRCTVPSIRLPHTEGVVSFNAVHSRYPELNTAIKVEVNVDKTRPEIRDSAMHRDDDWNPIPPGGSSDILQIESRPEIRDTVIHDDDDDWIVLQKLRYTIESILGSRTGASVSENLSNSALISQKVHHEKHPHSSGKPLQPTPGSSKLGQILPVSPSPRVSHVMNETFSQHNSKGSVAISDSPALKTPKLEHRDAESGSSLILFSKVVASALQDLNWLSVSVLMSPEENPSVQELEDAVANWAIKASSHMRKLESLEFNLSQIQLKISQLQDVIAPDLSKIALSLRPTLEEIKIRSQSAAALICRMFDEDLRRQGIVGAVALLGSVESTELSRMLAQFLGEDQMLAIVCRDYNALGKFRTELGLSINGGYNAVCLEDIRPRSKEPSIDPRKPLRMQDPTLPNGNVPPGFLGYAVNLISIQPNHLHWRTTSGHGLRETLFYRLFGKLQVYRDSDCMMAARPCIKAGAVSLDGDILRGNGLISVGHWESKILFPVMSKAISRDKLRMLAVKEMELAEIQQRRDVEKDAYQRASENFVICVQQLRASGGVE